MFGLIVFLLLVCGCLVEVNNAQKPRFALFPAKFVWNNISYKIENYPSRTIGLTPAGVDKTIEKAFKTWSEVANISFYRVNPDKKADITLAFKPRSHGHKDFDDNGRLNFAHAWYPNNSYVHFNDKYNWTSGPFVFGQPNLYFVALHEIGHALGINHSPLAMNETNSIMRPRYGYSDFLTEDQIKLHQDDIDAIQAHYGPSKEYLLKVENSKKRNIFRKNRVGKN